MTSDPTECLCYEGDQLAMEGVLLSDIARAYGTPCYIYSRDKIEQHWRAYDQAFASVPHLICYAVKANSNLAVLNLLAQLGSGFDIVSVGELERVLKAGGDADKVVFAGVGKRQDEMRRALEVGIRCFNVESAMELERLAQVAHSMGRRAPVALRVNPDVDARSHPYISTGMKENKFGIAVEEVLQLCQWAVDTPSLELLGVGCHIGSQLTELAPFKDAVSRLLSLVGDLKRRGITLKQLDLGGGLGITYGDEQPPSATEYAQALLPLLQGQHDILVEPGRSIVGNAGVLLTRIEYIKQTENKAFAIVDAAMNDLLRPLLYAAWHAILPVVKTVDVQPAVYDIVGPVCETGDFLGKGRELAVQAGDLLAVCSAGAYGFTMSSTYNSRPRVAEVLVDGGASHLIRQRESLDDLWRGESIPRIGYSEHRSQESE